MASKDALVLGLIAAGGLGAYVISQRQGGGAEGEPAPVEAGYIDPLTGLPGGGAGDVWGPGGFIDADGDGIPDGPGVSPFEQAALDQGEESLRIQERDGAAALRQDQRNSDRELAVVGGILGVGTAAGIGFGINRAMQARRAATPLARSAAGSLGRASGPLKASGPWLPETATQTASKASKTASRASQASRGSSVIQRTSRAASAVARSPVTRVVGRVATPLIAAETAVRAVQTGSALARGNRQQAAQRAGQTVGAGTAALSLGAVRITPKAKGKTQVRVANQRVTVNAPNSAKEAARNVRTNFRTVGRKLRRWF